MGLMAVLLLLMGVLLKVMSWEDGAAYDVAAQELASRFADNFTQFEEAATAEMKAGAPLATAVSQA